MDANVVKGDLVYIKSEGSKHKSREMYLVMDIQGRLAILQKINNAKFQSRRYEVPLSGIYHAIQQRSSRDLPSTPVSETESSSSSSSDDDYPLPPFAVEVESEDDEDVVPVVAPVRHPRRRSKTIVPPRRQPPRSHNLPARLAGNEWVR